MQTLKPEKKEAILKAARELFETVGYDKADIRTISKRSGMSCGNVYRYFSSKEEIFKCWEDVIVRNKDKVDSTRLAMIAAKKLIDSGGLVAELADKVDADVLAGWCE